MRGINHASHRNNCFGRHRRRSSYFILSPRNALLDGLLPSILGERLSELGPTHESERANLAPGSGCAFHPPVPGRTNREYHVDRSTRAQFAELAPVGAAFFLSPRVDRAL